MTISAEDLFALDVLGHLAYLALAIGMYFIAKGKAKGWSFRFVGELSWIFISYQLGLTSGILWGGIFLVIDTYAMFNATDDASA